uniref:Uncharacterized protein n=1 Tax=Meloidogyne hapla TaxID=6305 RepID=A0A1I8BNB7_MELHA
MSKFVLLLLFLIFIATNAAKLRLWDPLLHGITPEAKRDYDKAISKGNIQLAEHIRHRIGHVIISAFWARENYIRVLRRKSWANMTEWDLGFRAMKR